MAQPAGALRPGPAVLRHRPVLLYPQVQRMRCGMAKIWAIIMQDLRVFLRDRGNLITLLFVPAVMTIIIGLVDSGAFQGTPVRILDVIDRDGTAASAQFLDSVRQANPGLTLCPMDNNARDLCQLGKQGTLSESVALDRVAKSTSKALLEIPAGYGAKLAALQPVELTFRSSSTFGTSQAAEQAVQAALSKVNAAAAASQIGLSVVNTLQGQPLSADQAGQVRSSLYEQALALENTKPV